MVIKRVQGDAPSWKKHVDTDGGTTCCPPAVIPPDFPMVTGPAENLDIYGVDFDAPVVATVLADPGFPPAVPPTVNTVTLIAGSPGNPDTLRVNMDTTASGGGNFLLQITNDCGCSALVRFAVGIGG